MAYVLSHIHSLMRGSVGGATYLANQFHQIVMRARTAPVQPNTVYQEGIRTAFNVAENFWEQCTQEQRDAWADYAATCVYPGPAGPYTVPGRQLFVGTLALAKYAEAIKPVTFAIIRTAPPVAGWFNPGGIVVSEYGGASQGIAVTIQNPTDRSAVAVIDVSIAFNLTRNRFKGPWISQAKTILLVPEMTNVPVYIDRPLGTVGKAIFSHTRMFTAGATPTPPIAHALAFPVFLRHICELGPALASTSSTPGSRTTKKVAKKKQAKVAA